MRKLVYKIYRNEIETGKSELISKGDEKEVRTEFYNLEKEDGFDYDLTVGWELNGKSLGITLLETR